MRLIFRAMGRYKAAEAICIFIKLIGTLSELLLPYILEHIIDKVVPLGQLRPVIFWGLLMFAAALVCRQLNVTANRRAISRNHADSTLIMIAQRVSSIMGMTHILVMDNGKCVGYGTHEELLETCPAYRETYQVQMGEMA